MGDSILAKPRLEAISILSALAARTQRVRLGVACMASLPVRDPIIFACEWAGVDVLSAGRSVLVACSGLGGKPSDAEAKVFGLKRKDRATRMEEGIEVLKRLWSEDHVSFSGTYYRFEDVTIEPKPIQRPHPPIWTAHSHRGTDKLLEHMRRRTARLGDGYMAASGDPLQYQATLHSIRGYMKEYGRDPDGLLPGLYYNINVNEDRESAFEESMRFLDTYYMTHYKPELVESWLAWGSPEQCAAKLRQYVDVGVRMITLRLTGWDQMGQLKRGIEEVLPKI